jgi:hypothetical protein
MLTYIEELEALNRELARLLSRYDPRNEDDPVRGAPADVMRELERYLKVAEKGIARFKKRHGRFYEGVRIL